MPITREEHDRILTIAARTIADVGGPRRISINDDARLLAEEAGISPQRARHWLATAVRIARGREKSHGNLAE